MPRGTSTCFLAIDCTRLRDSRINCVPRRLAAVTVSVASAKRLTRICVAKNGDHSDAIGMAPEMARFRCSFRSAKARLSRSKKLRPAVGMPTGSAKRNHCEFSFGRRPETCRSKHMRTNHCVRPGPRRPLSQVDGCNSSSVHDQRDVPIRDARRQLARDARNSRGTKLLNGGGRRHTGALIGSTIAFKRHDEATTGVDRRRVVTPRFEDLFGPTSGHLHKKALVKGPVSAAYSICPEDVSG